MVKNGARIAGSLGDSQVRLDSDCRGATGISELSVNGLRAAVRQDGSGQPGALQPKARAVQSFAK